MNYFRLLTTTLVCSTLCTQSVFAADKINVVASFSILGDLVQQVGGEQTEIIHENSLRLQMRTTYITPDQTALTA